MGYYCYRLLWDTNLWYIQDCLSVLRFFRLLRLWVRIPPEAWVFVCCECCRLPLDEFSWKLTFEFFRKYFEKIQVLLKPDKNSAYFTWRTKYILITSRSFLLRMRNISDKSCRENKNTHFVFSSFVSKIVSFMR